MALLRIQQHPFQSTLPCGSDVFVWFVRSCPTNFNPRSLAGATYATNRVTQDSGISIHAPLRERRTAAGVNLVVSLFQSTLPCGSDAPFLYLNSGYADFNPRSLAGATGKTKVLIVSITHFNPRSLAGATGLYLRSKRHEKISIHAPLRERPYSVFWLVS